MFKDPIVAEVRAAGDRLARRFNYDLQALFAFLKEEERKRKAKAKLQVQETNGVGQKLRKTRRKVKKPLR